MSPVQGKLPLVQVKEPCGNLDIVTEGLDGGSGIHYSLKI